MKRILEVDVPEGTDRMCVLYGADGGLDGDAKPIDITDNADALAKAWRKARWPDGGGTIIPHEEQEQEQETDYSIPERRPAPEFTSAPDERPEHQEPPLSNKN